MRKLYLLIIGLITVFCIIVGSINHLGDGFNWLNLGAIVRVDSDDDEDDFKSKDSLDMEGTTEFDSFDNLELEIGVADITIKSSDRNAVTTNINKEKYVPVADLDGDTLRIRQTNNLSKHFKLSDLGSEVKCDIVIEVEGSLDDVNIELGVGELKLDGIKADNYDIELGVGDADIDDIDFDSCDIEVGTGDAKVSGLSEPADYKLELECGVGDIKVDDKKVSNEYEGTDGDKTLNIEVGVGDIRVDYK